MVMLRRWAVQRRENGQVTEVVSLMEREWSFYGWMDERVLGHFFALSRLNWEGDNLD